MELAESRLGEFFLNVQNFLRLFAMMSFEESKNPGFFYAIKHLKRFKFDKNL